MKVISSAIPEVLVIETVVAVDHRGFFLESFNQRDFRKNTGLNVHFVQDNHSHSSKNVLRGLHYQIDRPQGKLVRVSRGTIFDVTVDLRHDSPYLGKWVGVELSEHNHRQKWVPPGFAHGFLVLSDSADVQYKTTGYYEPELERCIAWDDPELSIKWPLGVVPSLSARDRAGHAFSRRG